MFAARYFAPRYFAPRYWANVGATVTVRPLVTIAVIDRITDAAGFLRLPWMRLCQNT